MAPNYHKCIIEDPYYDIIPCPEVFGKLLTFNLAENLTTISEFLAGKWVRNFAVFYNYVHCFVCMKQSSKLAMAL